MHEMALAEGILAVVLDVAGDEPVQRVRLRVGVLQWVVPDSLQFSFDLIAEATPAAGASLEIETVAARIRCRSCEAESEIEPPPFNCRACGSADIAILAGDELGVEGVELQSGWRYRPRPAETGVSAEHLQEHALQAMLEQGQ